MRLMNYPLAEAILGYAGGDELDMAVVRAHHEYAGSVIPRDGAAMAGRLVELLAAYDPATVAVQLNLLGSHDAPRLRTVRWRQCRPRSDRDPAAGDPAGRAVSLLRRRDRIDGWQRPGLSGRLSRGTRPDGSRGLRDIGPRPVPVACRGTSLAGRAADDPRGNGTALAYERGSGVIAVRRRGQPGRRAGSAARSALPMRRPVTAGISHRSRCQASAASPRRPSSTASRPSTWHRWPVRSCGSSEATPYTPRLVADLPVDLSECSSARPCPAPSMSRARSRARSTLSGRSAVAT